MNERAVLRRAGSCRAACNRVSQVGYMWKSKTLFQTGVVETHERRMPMNAKKVLMSVLFTVGIIALVSCGSGVSKEDYDKTVGELNKTKADLAQAQTKITEMEKSLSEAQAQLKSQPKEPSPAEKPAAVEKPAAAETGMQDKLAASEKEAADLRAKVQSLTSENANLQGMLEKLKAEYAELQKKVGGGMQTQQLPGGLPKKP
jgi:peptidoglycan hydrolase CwlO-like protein